jgi:heme exporter protein D
MPELGKYATYVLSAYGATILLIGGLVLFSWRQSQAARKRLEAVEDQNG